MDALVIPLAALAIPIIVAPTAMAFKHARRLREIEHMERMRALELGRVLPKDEPWWSPARIVVMIAGAVPIVAMCTAAIASNAVGFREEIWLACGAVGVSGVVGGTYMAGRYLFAAPCVDGSSLKPHYDPDAFDVVGRRG